MKKIWVLLFIFLVSFASSIQQNHRIVAVKRAPSGNVFSGDANCVAVYRFEDNSGFATDTKGSNDLSNDGVDEENTIYKQGVQSAAFVLANTDYLTITDANQDAGFPYRHDDGGGVEEDLSICFWIYWANGDLPSDHAEHQYIISKFILAGDLRVFAIYVDNTTDNLRFLQGHTNGTLNEFSTQFGTAFTHSIWYHVAVTYDNTAKEYVARIWDDNAGDFLGVNDLHTFTNAIDVRDVNLFIGMRGEGSRYVDGIIDELVIFNDLLSDAEIDKIRDGTFP